jgi:MFS family permease
VFLLGLAGFTLFSAACALGQDMSLLVTFRALQGGSGALMIPQGFGMLKEVFDDEELGRATRLFGPATGLAMLGAPILAGALIDANFWDIGWRLVFLINVPLGLTALPFALRSLPDGIRHPDLKLDVGGIWLMGMALIAIIYPLIQGESAGWPAWTFAMLSLGVVFLFVFVRYERRRGHSALIEASLFANRMYLSGVAVMLALFSAFGGLLLCVSLYGQLAKGGPPFMPACR